jgi:hypothetical protein
MSIVFRKVTDESQTSVETPATTPDAPSTEQPDGSPNTNTSDRYPYESPTTKKDQRAEYVPSQIEGTGFYVQDHPKELVRSGSPPFSHCTPTPSLAIASQIENTHTDRLEYCTAIRVFFKISLSTAKILECSNLSLFTSNQNCCAGCWLIALLTYHLLIIPSCLLHTTAILDKGFWTHLNCHAAGVSQASLHDRWLLDSSVSHGATFRDAYRQLFHAKLYLW